MGPMIGDAPKIPLLVSFSGVDGSGKSTQIQHLRSDLHAAGLRTRAFTLWDDAVVGMRYREGFVHLFYKSERGVGAPGKPIHRRDKNMRGWHLTWFRHLLYLIDALNLGRIIRQQRKQKPDDKEPPAVIIFDRYIYDELANLDLNNRFSRIFVRLIHSIVPRPDVAYLLDADPAEAYARKPEYPLDFMKCCRQAYLDLAVMLGMMTVVPPLDLAEARSTVFKAAQQRLAAAGKPAHPVSAD